MDRRDTFAPTSQRKYSIPFPAKNPFCTNAITTCKYNALTFLPKNLWMQFHKLANVYFLAIAVLQVIPDITISDGIPNILLPLFLVIFITAIKDIAEDLKRRRSDTEENNRLVCARVGGEWVNKKWSEVVVGDVLKVKKDEFFPADMILLYTSEKNGVCYIETKNLDGETNLKHKKCSNDLRAYFKDPSNYDNLQLNITCDDPNPMIYIFNGVVEKDEAQISLTADQLLLRGSSLKNTKYAIGLVVYTGHETKVMMNSSQSKAKFSKLEKGMNKQIIQIFILQIVICLTCALIYTIMWQSDKNDTESYLDLRSRHDNLVVQFIIIFLIWMLIFTNFVPISLIVTLETVKFLQGLFISQDAKMYDEEKDFSVVVQSSNLNEELGHIRYIFSDKTGTLTCNKMEFRKMVVRGVSYGTSARTPESEKVSNVDFVDPAFNPESAENLEMLLHLATCHTILVEEKNGGLEYNSSSPDELALVCAAKAFGVSFLGRDKKQNVLLDVRGEKKKIKILNILEFNSDRKRMSVIVKMPDGQIALLCKGADSVIEPRLVKDDTIQTTSNILEKYADEGLRTLLIAQKNISNEEYRDWHSEFKEAMKDIHNRDARVAQLSNSIEQNLTLVGATAIEDKLQDGVPETISQLRAAGIKIWVLTGDKIETAINIGFSCALLTSDQLRIIIDGNNTEEVRRQLKEARYSQKKDPLSKYALAISGNALLRAMKPEQLLNFLAVAEHCEVVLACRVTPQQKADVVNVIRKAKPNARTLSIGDGANDVNMILAAHVGIGISGVEGKQAARVSDFAIAQFSHLKRLLFVHGRECYRRNSYLICYNFYKNVVFVMPLFFYGMFSAFSAQMLYNNWMYQIYNVVFTSLPIILYALFDRETDYEIIESDPRYYRLGLKGKLFSHKTFWQWILEAVFQSCVICLITFYAICYYSGDEESGRIDNMYVGSVLVYGMVVILANFRIFMFSQMHFWFTWLIMILSVVSYFVLSYFITERFYIEQLLDNWDSRSSTIRMLTNPNTYTAAFAILVICCMTNPILRCFPKLWKYLQPKEKFAFHQEDEEITIETKRLLAENPDKYRGEPFFRGDMAKRRNIYIDTGFAFSGEAGQTPQVLETIYKRIETSKI